MTPSPKSKHWPSLFTLTHFRHPSSAVKRSSEVSSYEQFFTFFVFASLFVYVQFVAQLIHPTEHELILVNSLSTFVKFYFVTITLLGVYALTLFGLLRISKPIRFLPFLHSLSWSGIYFLILLESLSLVRYFVPNQVLIYFRIFLFVFVSFPLVATGFKILIDALVLLCNLSRLTCIFCVVLAGFMQIPVFLFAK